MMVKKKDLSEDKVLEGLSFIRSGLTAVNGSQQNQLIREGAVLNEAASCFGWRGAFRVRGQVHLVQPVFIRQHSS